METLSATAVAIDRFGGPEVLEFRQVRVPPPGPGQVRVKVERVSVNPADWKLRSGWALRAGGFAPRMPMVVGIDAVGAVVDVGPGVERLKAGDLVAGWADNRLGETGTYAEFVNLNARNTEVVPDGVSVDQAVTVPTAGLTAWQNLFLADRGDVQRGSCVLVNGAGGAVGTYAVQLAHVAGARVAARCGARSRSLIESIGASFVIDRNRPVPVDDFRSWASGGADVLLDTVIQPTMPEPLSLLRDGGVWIRVGTLGSIDVDGHPTAAQMQKRGLRSMLTHRDRSRVEGQMRRILELIADGTVRPPRVDVRSWCDVRQAQEDVEAGRTSARVVLAIVPRSTPKRDGAVRP